jgi:hypothetical protein
MQRVPKNPKLNRDSNHIMYGGRRAISTWENQKVKGHHHSHRDGIGRLWFDAETPKVSQGPTF